MKVVGYNDVNGTVELKFASDLSERSIDDYTAHSFTVLDENGTGLPGVLKALAQNGWNIALQQEIVDANIKNNTRVNEYKAIIGEEFTFDQEFLFAPPPNQAAENQPHSQGSMVI